MTAVTVVFFACGHRYIQATHKTTFEITKDPTLTRSGNCVIAVGATVGAADLPFSFKEAARKEGARIILTMEAGGRKETVRGWGHPNLVFSHPTDLVIRKSAYVCERTLAIKADKAAINLSRTLVERLKTPNQRIRLHLVAENY